MLDNLEIVYTTEPFNLTNSGKWLTIIIMYFA